MFNGINFNISSFIILIFSSQDRIRTCMDTFYSCLSPEQLSLIRLPIPPPDYLFILLIVLRARLELARSADQRFLRPSCLPFHHPSNKKFNLQFQLIL
jgi:hypothetical protein